MLGGHLPIPWHGKVAKDIPSLDILLFRILLSCFGAEATSFLVKTFYFNMDHVIHDIARLTKHLVDQQTAESDIMVYEATYYRCCVQE